MNITGNSFQEHEKSIYEKKLEEGFAMLAHDLKSPIFSQQNALNLLLEEKFGKLTAEQKEIISLLYSSNSYSVNLVNNILLGYKLNYGQVIITPEIADLSKDVKKAVEILKYTLTEKENTFNLNLLEDCCVNVDKTAINRVIMNILSNAVKYSPAGTEIKVSLVSENSSIIFTVESLGEYISENELINILKKNYMKTGKMSFASCGLGLYITSELIKLHGGNMIAKSFKDGKNVFGFVLKK